MKALFISALMLVISIFWASNSVVVYSESTTAQVAGASTFRLEPTGNKLVNYINSVRISHDVQPLSQSAQLQNVAKSRSLDMIFNQYYSHTTPEGTSYVNSMEVGMSFSCENLDMSASGNVVDVVNDWLKSPPHKNCLLDKRAGKIGISIDKFDDERFVSVLILSS
jgi:uncharacterized protein YkwD